MIGIMLYIETNKGLRNTVDNCQGKGSVPRDPQELQVKEETYVTKGTKVPSKSTKFLSSMDNFEDFSLNLTFKFRIKLVSAKNKENV